MLTCMHAHTCTLTHILHTQTVMHLHTNTHAHMPLYTHTHTLKPERVPPGFVSKHNMQPLKQAFLLEVLEKELK